MKKITFIVIILFTAALAIHAESLQEYFSTYQESSTESIDHQMWNNILNRYLDHNHPSGVNRFDYQAVSAQDAKQLEAYLSMLEETPIMDFNRDEQMAYWINFYNALTVKVIVDHYPVKSIKKISLPGSRRGPWKAKLVRVQGIDLSLDDMEHGILRPIWKDPRIHYAVNCASIGCPNLAPSAYTAVNLETMLDEAARDYINHPRGVNHQSRKLELSSIYKWYKEDFGDIKELYAHLLQYADENTAGMIQGASGSPRYDYDWDLNAP